MGDYYVVPSMISQAPFRDSDETNPHRNGRDVFLRRDRLSSRGVGRHVIYPNSPGLVWEIKPVAATSWEIEYDFGRWEYSSPKHIKASGKKLGTTTLTDKEIDEKAQAYVTRLRKSKLDFNARAALWQLKILSKVFPTKSMMGQQFRNDRSSAGYNAWFKNCHSFAIDMIYDLCGQSFLKRWKLNFYFSAMPGAEHLVGLQRRARFFR